jgi:predicted amidophosphoribosyltransferase
MPLDNRSDAERIAEQSFARELMNNPVVTQCCNCGKHINTWSQNTAYYCDAKCREIAELKSELALEKKAHFCSLYYASDTIPDLEEYMGWSRARVKDGWTKDD